MDFAFALFRHFPHGGLQRDMMAIARATAARGHAVTIYTREWQGERPEGIAVRELPVHGWTNHGRDRRMAEQLRDDFRAHERVVGFNKMPGLDFYYAADGCLAARYAHARVRLLPRYQSRLAMEAAVFHEHASTEILSISPKQKVLYQHYYGTPESRFHDLPPGIGRDRVVPADYPERRRAHRQRWGLEEDRRLFLFVGSGFRVKGLDRALHAFARQSDTRAVFFVVGEDACQAYRRLARKLAVADRVYFLGGQDDVPAWLWSADVLLHPAYQENTGTVLLEAAVAGLPVVTTSACGYADWIRQSGMGQVLDAAEVSTETLTAAVERIVARPREPWLERGRDFAREADIFDLTEHAVDCITGSRRP
jgi:UDP-glucose:(heptosyl)LPS alpha-1,3-glucosyltransferase